MFARRVNPTVRPRQKTEHGTDVYDAPVAMPTHRREHGLRNAHHAKEIRLEQLARFFDACLLHSAGERVARIVDQDVDLARLFQYRPNSFPDALVVIYVHWNQLDSGDRIRTAKISHRSEYARVAFGQQL